VGNMSDFCKKHGLFADTNTIEFEIDRFIAEMQSGLEGAGSIKMLPAYIDPSSRPDFSQRVIVMDAGGTNLRIALVAFPDGVNPKIEYFENHPMPGTQGILTADEFFYALAEKLAPVIDKADKIGICFSFPAQITADRDARIIHFTKEVKVSGSEGLLVGENLLAALKAQGFPCNKSITVINDTVAALLGGVAGTAGRLFDSYIGIILGTGTNTCYVEANKNVSKYSALASSAGKTIINLESGGYALAPRSSIDALFDAKTDFPNAQLFEKMISGAYAGDLFLEFMKAAAKDGCFSTDMAKNVETLSDISGKDIDVFCDYPYGENILAGTAKNEQDVEALYTLVDGFFSRIAMLITINLGSLLKKSGAGKKPFVPVCISAEGTTFYKARLFRPKLDYYMEAYVRQKLGINYHFVKIENGTILGTAVAGLL